MNHETFREHRIRGSPMNGGAFLSSLQYHKEVTYDY